jgi:hypothetical protein
MNVFRTHAESSNGTEESFHTTVSALRETLFEDVKSRRFRLVRLVDAAIIPQNPGIVEDADMIYRLWTAVRELLRRYSSLDDLTQSVAQLYHLLAAKLPRTLSTDLPDQLVDSTQAPERCDICDTPIAFKNIRSAECPRGHQFGEILLCTLEILALTH